MSGEAGQGLRAAGTPPAAVRLDVAVVRALLAAQHPDLAALALRAVAAGWDNATFRLGQDLAVRLPRRAVAATLMEHEQRWLRGLARRLPCPSPPRCAPAVPGPATRGAGVWSHGCPASPPTSPRRIPPRPSPSDSSCGLCTSTGAGADQPVPWRAVAHAGPGGGRQDQPSATQRRCRWGPVAPGVAPRPGCSAHRGPGVDPRGSAPAQRPVPSRAAQRGDRLGQLGAG